MFDGLSRDTEKEPSRLRLPRGGGRGAAEVGFVYDERFRKVDELLIRFIDILLKPKL